MNTYFGHQEDASGNILLPVPSSLVPADGIEYGDKAVGSYVVGNYMVWNNHLYRVTKAIAKNATISSDSTSGNVKSTTISWEVERNWQALSSFVVAKTFHFTKKIPAQSAVNVVASDFSDFAIPTGYNTLAIKRFYLGNNNVAVTLIGDYSATAAILQLRNLSTSEITANGNVTYSFVKSDFYTSLN